MNDYSDLIGQHLSSVASQTISGLDENPDDAARAVDLENSTGVAAPVISGDLEDFEKNHRAMLASNIVVNNPELRKYVQSHPMAAAVSNDDWGNLDQFSQGAGLTQRVLTALHTPLDSMMDAALSGAKQGFQEGYGEYSPEVQRALDPRQNILGPVGAAAATALYGTGSLLSGVFGATVGAAKGAATAAGGEQFGREIGSMTEYEMMKGEGRPEVQEMLTQGMKGRLEYETASQDFAQAQIQAKNNSVMYWAQNGKEPPRGISPEVDQAKADLNAQVLSKLDEDLANAQASLTRERSPDMFRRFVEQHYGDSTIGIHGDAAVALYGDKQPEAGDGLLGSVSGLADQLAVARATGADVHIPVADWVMVDPAVAKALHDDVRVWPGGITAREATEPVEPKVIVDSPLAQERGANGLEPMFSMGDRKLQLQKTILPEGQVDAYDITGNMDKYDILDENGAHVGNLRIGRVPDTKELLVDWVGGQAGMWANSFGPSLIRDLKRQLKALYPDYEYLTGYRQSGARWGKAANLGEPLDEAATPRVRLAADEPSTEDFHSTRQILDSAWREVGDSGIFGAYEPTSIYTKNELAMAKIVQDEIKKLVGEGPSVHRVSGIVATGQGLNVSSVTRGAYIPHADRAPTILFDMLGPDPLGVGRHEAIHYLRRYGVFSPEEWDTLEQAALNEDWLHRYQIGERYGHLDIHGQLEEAVAEGFREWAQSGRPTPHGMVAGIFQKLWDFLQSIKQRFTELFGHEPTWEELFQKTSRGEIGARGPGEAVQPGTYDLQSRMSADDMDNLKANSLGLDQKTFQKLQEQVEKRYEEDLEAAQKRAEREQKRRQTNEWKSNRAEMAKEVEATIRQRPDVAADLFIGSGELYGEKLRQRYTLRDEDLSTEQKASLPKHYVSKNGLPIDEVARLFGYGSGDTLVERLSAYNSVKGDLSSQAMLKKLIDTETDRQMEAKYGNLQSNIADEARDQALSDTNLNLALQEYQAVAMQSGAQAIDKDLAKQTAEDYLAKMPAKDVTSDAFMRDVARHASNAAKSQINGDPASTVQSLQAKTLSLFMAAEARKIEKERATFERTAKQMSNRIVPSMDPEYTNYVHDILTRIGMKVKRSAEDLQKEIGASSADTLEKFVQQKTQALREIPVWDQLYDPKWQKPYDQLTVEEFQAIANTVKSLVHNGKQEMKVEVAGNKMNLAELKEQLIAQLEKFKQIDYTKPGGARKGVGYLRAKIADHLQLENIFNRWDEYDPHGVWNQFGIRGLIEGANQADAWKKEFAGRIREADDKVDMYKSVDNTLFRQPIRDGFGGLIQFNRGNLRAVMLNAGNSSNLTKLAKGYGLNPDQVMAWIHSKATKEDWDWVQKTWDMFSDLKTRSDTMYRNLTGGVPAQDIRTQSIQTNFGEYKGGYYPVIWHDIFKGKSKALIGKNVLEENNYVRATTPAGYTKSRTGYVAPMALDIDQLPNRLAQEIHDIALRPAVIEASKIFYDSDIQQAITNHYGAEYSNLLIPYLRDVANVQNFMSKSQAEFNTISGFFRQNLITTLVGLNPGTVMKHFPTALGLSIKEVGPQRFLDAVKSLYSINEYTGESNWQFAMKNSLELQRRERNWRETLYGAAGSLGETSKLTIPTSKGQALQQFQSLRSTIMELSSKPVALSDKVSAVPTWLAQYRKSMEEGSTHGDAIYDADRAVRRAHGSTATTNKPQIMRDSNPWFTSVYNFYSDVMNRQMETLWRAGKTMDLVKSGDWKEAKAFSGMVAGGMMAYVIWPAMVEQWVSPVNEDPKASWAKKAGIGLTQSLSSSWVGVRDLVNGILQGKDPSAGLITTAYKEVSDFARDVGKNQPTSPQHAGRLIQNGMSLAGLLTGVVPGQIGREAQLAHDVSAGVEHPRGPWQWLVGLRFGTTKGHSKTWDNYLKGNYK